VLAAAFVVLAALVAVGAVRQLDQAVFEVFVSVNDRVLDLVGSAFAILGRAEVTGGIALGLAVARWRRGSADAWVPLLVVLVTLVEIAIKTAIPQPPPPEELSRSDELVPYVHIRFAGAFPSGHVARTAFLAGISHIPTWLAALVIALMMVSRVYLGDHWISDVVGGLLLGLLVAQTAAVAERRLRRH
jgi:membrane-associated phospholipid phosphatase